ncbi:MAG: hypothetical protein ACKV2T_16295 [Kofleriaceae bacterium]
MIGRVVLASLLALAACKKKDSAGSEQGSAAPTSSTGASSTGGDKPSGDKRVNDSGWSTQKGPGFSVSAPGAASAVEKVPASKDARALERYTFHTAPLESFVVEITEIPAKDDLGMVLGNMRMVLAAHTQSLRREDLIDASEPTGEVMGRDIWYVVDVGDDTLRARSKLLGKGQKVYEVRAYAPKGTEPEAKVDKFVESFVLTP